MKKSSHLCHPHQRRQHFCRQICGIIILLAIILIAIIIRLIDLQIVHHHRYSTLSQKNLLALIPTPPTRGLIYDRNGNLIASNKTSFSLSIIPEQTIKMDSTLKDLRRILPISNNTIKLFYYRLHHHRPYQHVPLLNHLTQKQAAKFVLHSYYFPGVMIDASQQREYPQAKLFSPALGYTAHITAGDLTKLDSNNYIATTNIGKSGIEKYYETALHGLTGAQAVECDASGHSVHQLSEQAAQTGYSLLLTLDPNLQRVAQKALAGQSGAVVAIQPKTGDVVTMVSMPTYDPNVFIGGMSHQQFKDIFQNKSRPLFNRATQGQFAIGSTVKPFYALYALDNNIITTQDEIYDRGWFRLANTSHVYHDWKRSGHGWVNLQKAITVSCDTYFYNLASKMTIYQMDELLNDFHFGRTTGIDLPYEQDGIIPSPQWKQKNKTHPWYTGDKIETVIGQGFLLATPLQLANAATLLANRGTAIQPHLLSARITPDNHIIPINYPLQSSIKIKNSSSWKTIINDMRQVILNPLGTGEHFGRNPPYTVAAKTGTAQLFGHNRDEEHSRTDLPKKLRNNHLFIAFAPVKNPKIAIAVIVEHAALAAKVARKVLDAAWQETNQYTEEIPHSIPVGITEINTDTTITNKNEK